MIAVETNRYAQQKKCPSWVDVSSDGIWSFLGIIVLMGIHKLPRISDYWSRDTMLGLNAVRNTMSRARFWSIWSNLHIVDNEMTPARSGPSRKIQPVLDCLSETFLKCYSPGQELAIDEVMVKYKGHAKGKVHMPRKPIKSGYKIWCCSCSCCGYLCTFQVYDGRPVDPETGKEKAEKGMVVRVVSDLMTPFWGINHVLFCDNYFTSAPLVEELAKHDVYLVGSIQQTASGFPDSLKGIVPPVGRYVSTSVCGITYFVFHDRSVVRFITNAFPETMKYKVFRHHPDGVLREQDVPPLLPAYNKSMCGVDVTAQCIKTYGYDRKCKRSWIRLFYACFDLAINNAYVLHRHNCRIFNVKPVEQLHFRLELARLLLKAGAQPDPSLQYCAQEPTVCSLVKVEDVGLKRGKCHQCMKAKRGPIHHTTFACAACRVRLCKLGCFAEFHCC